MISDNLIKQQFFFQGISKYSKSGEKKLKLRANQLIKKKPGTLADTIKAHAEKTGTLSGKIVFEIIKYHRFQDMRLKSRIYNKIITWFYFKTAEHLQYNFTQEAISIIRENLSKINTNG
jgi:hypothetical protein